MNMTTNNHKLECDGKDYGVITHAIKMIPANKKGMTCEIGLRRGGGTGHIMTALSEGLFPFKVHVAVDPFGNIIYAHKDGVNSKMDYTNSMRDTSIGHIYTCAMNLGVNFLFINLEDSEFFKRYADGIPVYSDYKHVLSEYMFVHFDGPHQYEPVYDEFVWFNERMTSGATTVFDDIKLYDHDKLEKHIFACGWKLLKKSERKASYQKG